MERPKKLTNMNLNGLISCCESYIQEQEDGIEDTDTKHYIFEAAMEAVYGKDIWKYITQQFGSP